MQNLTWLFGLSLDSGLCCFAIGTQTLSRRERAGLVLAFGLCDMAASLAGPALASGLPEPPEFLLYALGAAMLGGACRYKRKLLYGLPLLLSIDNLMVGAGTPGAALNLGVASALWAVAGLGMGKIVSTLWSRGPAPSLARFSAAATR
jgi:hypothetical protein